MEKNQVPGLTPAWIIVLAAVLAVWICATVPIFIGIEQINPSHWLGLAGSCITAAVAALAIIYARGSVVRQLRIGTIGREEERIERELPGLRSLLDLLKQACVLVSIIPTPAAVNRVLTSLKLVTPNSRIADQVAILAPLCDDTNRRKLAGLVQRIYMNAITVESLRSDPEEDEQIQAAMYDVIEIDMASMRDALQDLAEFKDEIEEKIARYEAQLPKFRAELQRFFDS